MSEYEQIKKQITTLEADIAYYQEKIDERKVTLKVLKNSIKKLSGNVGEKI